MSTGKRPRAAQRTTAAFVALSVALSSCTTMSTIPEERFKRERTAMSDEAACAALFTAGREYKQTGRTEYFAATLDEITRRGKNVEWCNQRKDEQAETAAGALVFGALIALVAVAAKGGGAPSNANAYNTTSRRAPATDTDWDWDQFYDANGELVWRCRGVQTGQFAIDAECINKVQLDLRWPGLSFKAGAAAR